MTRRPPVLGLTGFAGSGKTAVARWLARRGARVIDADRSGHAALAVPAVRRRLVRTFGREVLGRGGRIDRRRLGARVFADPRALHSLERIVHPAMRRQIRAELKARSPKLWVLDAALLHRLRLDRLCARVWRIEAPFAVRLARVRARGWTAAELRRRDAAQRETLDLSRARIDAVIRNAGTPAALSAVLTPLWKELPHA